MFMSTTGQCTGAVVNVPEPFCQFVQGSATRARLGRCGFVACFFKVCGRLSSSRSCRAEPSICFGRGRFQQPGTGSGTGTRRKHSAWTRSYVFDKLSERLFEAFRTVSCTRVFTKIQLRQVQQGNGVLMSAATGQCVRTQISVCDRTVSSAPAYHDHDVFAREEPVHAVVQATVQRVVDLGFQNGLPSTKKTVQNSQARSSQQSYQPEAHSLESHNCGHCPSHVSINRRNLMGQNLEPCYQHQVHGQGR